MKGWRTAGFLALLLAGAGGYWLWWKADAPRRASIATLSRLDAALHNNASGDLRHVLVMPAAVAARTDAEQSEFLRKALADEISPEGLSVLKREGQFGPLTNIFPAQAAAWSQAAGVNAGDCVAFKLERNGVCAEVVLVCDGPSKDAEAPLRIVRCNNVKQLASAQ